MGRAPWFSVREREWVAAAVCGGLATSPFVVGIVGWFQHWNAYTNLYLTLSGPQLWFVVLHAWRDRPASRQSRPSA